MSENKRYCMGCMSVIDSDATICPHCQYSGDTQQLSPYLSQGQTVAGRYLIGKALGMANDSITYIGLDTQTETTVTVCEYYPHRIAHRANGNNIVSPLNGFAALYESCLESFLSLWRGIRMFDDVRCLPKVLDIVSENETAYCICESKECMPLKNYFEKTRKPLSYSKAVAAFIPLLNALKSLHNAGIVHGSITPSTIQVGSDGRLNLTGFSIPQCRSDIRELNAKPVAGFSAIEIYETSFAKAESDIYSIMAVMYYSITGSVLPKATDRAVNENLTLPSSIASTIPKNVLDTLARSLAVYPYNRISSAAELIACLKADNSEIKRNPDMNKKTQQTKSAQSKKAAPTTGQKRPSQGTAAKAQAKRSAPKKKQEEKVSNSSFIALGFTTFVAAAVVISILFCVLYTTVLYKSFDIPFLNSAFSSMTFLPINREKDDEHEQIIATTEEMPSVSETSYATVADFTKLTYDYIISNDSFQRNFVFKFKEEASDTVKKGGIISQNATAGESVPVGTEIVLVVSTGIEQIVVPDVKGKSFDEAKKILEDAKLEVSKELLENKENKTPDEVYSMSVDPGQSVDKGTIVVLSVWDEVPETTTQATTKKETTTKKEAATKKETTTKAATTKPTTTAPTTTKKAAE
ncbi:MAG: PASTA domain-containing protein [Clostridia bacterium]|nr:PASTA domain-containing protein [Clostridia bacterium]